MSVNMERSGGLRVASRSFEKDQSAWRPAWMPADPPPVAVAEPREVEGRDQPATTPAVAPAAPPTLHSHVAAFIADRIEVGPGHSEAKASLHDAWRQWCAENGREPGKALSLGALASVLASSRYGAETEWTKDRATGLRLRPLESDPEDPQALAEWRDERRAIQEADGIFDGPPPTHGPREWLAELNRLMGRDTQGRCAN